MSDHNWRGRSLGFIRTVTGGSVRYPTAQIARQSLPEGELIPGDLDAPVGAFVWYDAAAHGNVTLSLGEGMVLAIGPPGKPMIMTISNPYLGTYLGWSTTLGATPAEPEEEPTHNDKGEPYPGQPERLSLVDVGAGWKDGRVEVSATFTYEPWCCQSAHEVTDAIQAATQQVRKNEE